MLILELVKNVFYPCSPGVPTFSFRVNGMGFLDDAAPVAVRATYGRRTSTTHAPSR
jgi:hypothetical protein